MAIAKRFTRKTGGLNAQVIVAPAVAISADADLATFITTATLGEIGVFDGNNARHTNAIVAGEEYFVVQKTSGGIKRTTLQKWNDTTVLKKLYVAPVKQVSAVGYNRSGGSFNAATIAAGQTYGIKVIETTEGNEPYPTWSYEYYTKPSDTYTDVIIGLAARINNPKSAENKQNKRLVQASPVINGTFGNYTLTGTTPTATFTNGSAIVTLGGTTPALNAVVGDFISVDTAATPSATVGTTYKVIAISAGVSITLDRPFEGTTIVMTQAQAQGTRLKVVTAITAQGIEFTTVDFDVHFRLAVYESLVNADITYTTAYVKGNGEDYQVRDLELEGQTYAGDTTKNTVFAADFGQQDYFWLLNETYDYIEITYLRREDERGFSSQTAKGYITLACAKSSGGITAALATLFGV